MLHTLRIRNLVIFEDVTIRFGEGLNLLTGETGAGKSILVDALGLVSGARADRSLVRSGAERAIVEAQFEINGAAEASAWARRQGTIDDIEDGQLIVRRELPAAGSGRIMINGSPCTLGQLREWGTKLLELHGQHEHQSLLSAERHLALLDRLGRHDRELARVAECCDRVLDAREKREQMRVAAAQRDERREQLQKQLQEIDAVNPKPGELEELDRERTLLRNSSRVADLLRELLRLCQDGEPTAASLAFSASQRAANLAELDGTLEEPARRLEAAALELQDLGATFRDYRDEIDFNPSRLEEIEGRMVALEKLRLRYGVDEGAVLQHREEMAGRLAALGRLEDELADLDHKLVELEENYVQAAGELGARRRAASNKMVPAIGKQFQELALEKAEFEVLFSLAGGEEVLLEDGASWPLRKRGAERAEFQLAANPGEPARPLSKSASGGELSRVMLAMHMVVEGAGADRVLVFDEVDAGIGGAVADAVGARLASLAGRHQVMCVTHLPQVAAYADHHLVVHKFERNGRTQAGINDLEGEDRVGELARMLGGKKTTPASLRHASELLSAAGRQASGRKW